MKIIKCPECHNKIRGKYNYYQYKKCPSCNIKLVWINKGEVVWSHKLSVELKEEKMRELANECEMWDNEGEEEDE